MTGSDDEQLIFPSVDLNFDDGVFMLYKSYAIKLGAETKTLYTSVRWKEQVFNELRTQLEDLVNDDLPFPLTYDLQQNFSNMLVNVYKFQNGLIKYEGEIQRYNNLVVDILKAYETFLAKYWPDNIPADFKDRCDDMCLLIHNCMEKCGAANGRLQMMLAEMANYAAAGEAKLAAFEE